MAGIDKTYTDSYKAYKEFKTWANEQTITFFDGHKERVGNYVWVLDESDFDGGEIPIMNTPTWLDIYLIQNCKIGFVLDRLKDVYSDASLNEFQNIDLTAKPPEEFQQNRKISITRNKRTKFPIHSKPYSHRKWWLKCEDRNFYYNDETKRWVRKDNYYPYNTSYSDIKSIKGVIRHLRKQHLPKGLGFKLCGTYVGEEYSIIIK